MGKWGGLAQGLGIRLFAFGGAYWPLATLAGNYTCQHDTQSSTRLLTLKGRARTRSHSKPCAASAALLCALHGDAAAPCFAPLILHDRI